MSILTAIQQACTSLGLAVPAALYGQTERELVELQNIANTVAKDVLRYADWQILREIHEINGDDSTEDFPLPTDYDRMMKRGAMWSTRFSTPYRPIIDHEEWLEIDVRSYEFVTGVWTIFGGQIHYKPAPATGETIKFWYIKNTIVKPTSGANKASFTADSDQLLIGDDELMKRGAIWRWRQDKGLPYAEDLTDFSSWISDIHTDDRGSKILRPGGSRMPKGVRISYPTVITP